MSQNTATDLADMVNHVDGQVTEVADQTADAIRALLAGAVSDRVEEILDHIVESVEADVDGEADQYGTDNYVPDDNEDEETSEAGRQALTDAFQAGVDKALDLLRDAAHSAKYRA